MPKIVRKTAPNIFGFKTITFTTQPPYFLQRATPQNTRDIANATTMNFVGRMKEITKPRPSDAKIIPALEFLLPIKKPPAKVLLIHYIQGEIFLLPSLFSFPAVNFSRGFIEADIILVTRFIDFAFRNRFANFTPFIAGMRASGKFTIS